MLQRIRDRTHGLIAGIIIVLIILTFALWGVHSYFIGNVSEDVIATVNGVDISKRSLVNTYERFRRQQEMEKVRLNHQDEQRLKRYALNMLIDTEVQKQAALLDGYEVFDEQVERYIVNLPDFQIKGEFSSERFKQLLSAALLSEDDFFSFIKTQLLIDQVKQGLFHSAFSLSNELNYSIGLLHQERDIDYLKIPLNRFLSHQVVSEKEIQAYYNAHHDAFQIPEKISIAYVELSLSAIESTVHPTESELTRFYYDNRLRYSKSSFKAVHEQVKAHYIQKKAEEKFVQMRDQLTDIADQSQDTLSLIANQLHLPITMTSFFAQHEDPKDKKDKKDKKNKHELILDHPIVRQVAFSDSVLNQKNNSDILQLDSTHLIVLRLQARHPSAYLSLKNVYETIKKQISVEKAQKEMRIFAVQLTEQLNAGKKVKAIDHLEWKKIGYVNRSSTTVSPTILEKAFRMSVAKKFDSSGVNKIPLSKHFLPVAYDIAHTETAEIIIALRTIKMPKHQEMIKQYAVMDQQLSEINGLLEYELYKQSHLKRAKIIIH